MTTEEKLVFLKDLIHCEYDIAFREYDGSGILMSSDGGPETIDLLFEKSGCLSYALSHSSDSPLFLSSGFGLLWGSVSVSGEEGCILHVIGPVLNTAVLQDGINESARKALPYLDEDFDFQSFLLSLPVIPMQMFQHYILMLNLTLTGEEKHRDDIHYQRTEVSEYGKQKRNRHLTYMAEQELLYNVREGNIDCSRALSRSASLSTGVQIKTSNPLEQATISVIVFTSLCAREAIKGGLSPDTAYAVGDAYIQNMTDAKTISTLSALSHAMYIDFIRRVRKAKDNDRYSRTIQECCDYIRTHMEDELSATVLSDQFGYTPYYLSRRFKSETGMSLSEYVDSVRIEKAKSLLLSTNENIASIASLLHYCSSTYFCEIFRRLTGMKPSEYRKNQGKATLAEKAEKNGKN